MCSMRKLAVPGCIRRWSTSRPFSCPTLDINATECSSTNESSVLFPKYLHRKNHPSYFFRTVFRDIGFGGSFLSCSRRNQGKQKFTGYENIEIQPVSFRFPCYSTLAMYSSCQVLQPTMF